MRSKSKVLSLVNIVLISIFTLSIFSCASSRKVVNNDYSMPPVISLNKLLKNIDTADSYFKYLNIKRIDVEMDNGKKKQSFRASLKMEYDKFIQISVNAPLGIEVIRILLTQDSFAMINYHNKYYMQGDYNDFTAVYGIDVNYKLLEKIFSNKPLMDDLFNESINGNGGVKLCGREFGKYIISSERNIDRKVKKNIKKRDKHKDYTLINYTNHIDSDLFKVIVSNINDVESSSNIEVNYSKFENIGGVIFPENLEISSRYEDSNLEVKMNYSKIEFNTPVKQSFRIPTKYSKREF